MSSTARHNSKETVTIVSATHDYRSPRRAGVHGLAGALANLGYQVNFVSIRFSPLSIIKRDGRLPLWSRANRLEHVQGVECYLWRTPFHPFGVGACAAPLTDPALHTTYAHWPSPTIDALFRQSQNIIIESGLAIMLIARARRINPQARIVYRCSDTLDAIGANVFLEGALRRAADRLSHATLISRSLASRFAWMADRVYFAPQGIDHDLFSQKTASPYSTKLNAVSVGSMLFDADAIRSAASAFPNIGFHVIGAGMFFEAPANVIQHKEMSFKATLPFLQHASFGIAPYRAKPGCAYLADSSLKLTQFGHLGLPAICPDFAAGGRKGRCAYIPGDSASISRAVEAALHLSGRLPPTPAPTWEDAALRTINPYAFPDTRIAASAFEQAA